jgi:secreted trypsin-like serine protease
MASPFTLNENCKPIPLVAPSATRPAEGHPLMTSGYGYYEYGSNGRPNRVVSRYLKYSDMEYVSVATCKSIWTGQTIDKSVICADKANTSICSGDSGGPLTIEEDGETRLIGLTSWAHVYCNSNGLPQGWANVQYPEYNEWMRTNANL